MADLVADAAKPRILFAIGVRPLVVAGGKSFIGSLIREAGGVNVAEDAPIPYPRFSMEEVIRHDPDLIVVANKECSGAECSNQWKAHKTLGAMRNDKIYEMDADLMTRPSLKIMDALEQLAAIFHPELFGKTMSAGQAGSR
jgi:iron complex transport system substrate-binding protein